MEASAKRLLKSVTLELRHLLEGRFDSAGRWQPGDLERRLASLGVRGDRESRSLAETTPEALTLTAEDHRARQVVDEFLRSRAAAGKGRREAVAEFLREAAYTWANRLIALRCMESRELIDPAIRPQDAYGGRSLVHHRLARRQPELCAGPDGGLFAMLDQVFREQAERLPRLFDPLAPAIALRPSPAALQDCIGLLSLQPAVWRKYRIRLPDDGRSADAPPNPFVAPDALGWTYQYWNTEEKDRVFASLRTKGAKIAGADIIPATQLYTEDYMVKFLVQNSLGALWLSLHPESLLAARWEYFVRDADRTLVYRPAAGAGDGTALPREGAGACDWAGNARSVRDLTLLDPACGSGHFLLEAFDVFYDLYLDEGELTQPAEIVTAILTRNLFGLDIDPRAVQIAEAALWMKAAERAFEFSGAATNLAACVGEDLEEIGSLAREAPPGPAFDLLRRRYDVVVANPPYMGSRNMGPGLKRHVERYYEPGKRDLYAAFMMRCRELAADDGRVAMVTQQSWMFLRSFADLRAANPDGLLHGTRIELLAHLGPGAFEEIGGEIVNPVMFVLTPQGFADAFHRARETRLTCFRLVGVDGVANKAEALRAAAQGRAESLVFRPRQNDLARLPGAPLVYWVSPQVLAHLSGPETLATVGGVKQGLATGWNERFVRFHWECPAGTRWRKYAKGGGYRKWCGLELHRVDWEHDGRRVRSLTDEAGAARSAVRNESTYFRPGITYSLMAGGALGVRLLDDSVYDVASMSLFPEHPAWDRFAVMALLNATLPSYFARLLTQELKFNTSYVTRLPLPDARFAPRLRRLGQRCAELKRALVAADLLEESFDPATLDPASDAVLSEPVLALHVLEAAGQRVVCEAFELSASDLRAMLDETGTPAGWYPLLAGYDALPDVAALAELIEPADWDQHPRRTLAEDELALLRRRLRAAYEAGPESRESPDTEADDDEDAAHRVRQPIPAETFLETLCQTVELHPVSVQALVREGVLRDGWQCLSEQRRACEDRATWRVLRHLEQAASEVCPLPPPAALLDDPALPLARRANVLDDFFPRHVRQFRRRPIVWQVESGRFGTGRSSAFAAWLDSRRLDEDTLPTLRSQHIGPLRQRLETELRDVRAVPSATRDARQQARCDELEESLGELQRFDAAVDAVVATGFGPESLGPTLLRLAIEDSLLALKARWLRRLSELVADTVLPEWRAEAASLHPEAGEWLAAVLTRLERFCAQVGPRTGEPDGADGGGLAALVAAQADVMHVEALARAGAEWWTMLEEAVFGPLKAQIKQPSSHAAGATKRLERELRERTASAKALRHRIEAWRDGRSLTWGEWLMAQPLYDEVARLDGRRPQPATLAEFVAQESRYVPDRNDGVRVNVAPLQRAGLLANDVLPAKDVDQALADRAAWRADERRWVREGRLPCPGWWEVV